MATSVRRISANSLKPGMVLANAVISDSGSLLVSERTRLTQPVIDHILMSGILVADIYIVIESEIENSFAKEQKKLLAKHAKMTHAVKDTFERMRLTHSLPVEEFIDIANDISTTMIDTPGLLHTLQMVKVVDDYTYTHSVNVGVLAGLIGKWTGHRHVPMLITAGLLHDVGKTRIPLEILNKPASLSLNEMQMMRSHSTLGYELAMGSTQVAQEALDGILHHHERLDGTGYPSGLKGLQVSHVAKILAVADVFDAMTSDRVYRGALTPFEVLDEIFDEMFTKLDPGICFVFRQRIKELLVGSKVVLNNGMKARVIFVEGDAHFKVVLQDDAGQYFSPEYGDLRISEFSY